MTYQVIAASPPIPSVALAPPDAEALRQVFQESVRSTAFCLTLSKRMCAALLAALRLESEPCTAWETLSVVFLAQRATGRALQERGLVEGRRLTRSGRIVAQLVELAGFAIADFDPALSQAVAIKDDSPKPDNTFREYVTSTAFCLTLSRRMLETLGAMQQGDRYKLNDYPHFLSTAKALLERGLIWHDETVDRRHQTPWKLTDAGRLVAELAVG